MESARRSKQYPYATRQLPRTRVTRNTRIPHADKFDLNVDREGFLEHGALSPTLVIVTTEHLIREGNLLVVARREKAHLCLTTLHST